MKSFAFAFLITIPFSSTIVFAQSFQKLTDGFVPVSDGNTIWADLDNDGDLDLIFSGMVHFPTEYGIFTFENSNGEFHLAESGLPDIRNGSISPGDFDNDGDLDMLVSGLADHGNISALYENTGSFSFSLKYSFLGLLNSSTEWLDIDNDGDIDFLLGGDDDNDPEGGIVSKSFLFENTGNGFVQLTGTGIPPLSGSSVESGDINNDGRVDLLISGLQDETGIHSYLFLNNGNKTFSIDPLSSLTHLFLGDIEAGDADNDGDLDVLHSGVSMTYQVQTFFYENINNRLVEQPITDISPVSESSGNTWFDYDNDNDLDIIVSGYESWTTFNRVLKLFINEGDGTFTERQITEFEPIVHGSVAVGDYDNDGDFDISFMGRYDANDNNVTGIYKNLLIDNSGSFPNIAPGPPTDAFSIRSFRRQVQLRSGAGTDPETPAPALTYNFYLADSDKKIVSPAVNFSTGALLTTNTPNGYSQKIVVNNAPEGNLSWAAQTVDGGRLASIFSAEQSFFHINGPEAVSISVDDPGHISLSWIDHSAIESQYVITRATLPSNNYSTISTLPANSVNYTDEFDFDTETYYYYRIHCTDGLHASGYDSLAAVIPEVPADLVATSVNASTISLSWQDQSEFEIGYVIERRGPGQENFVVLDTLVANSISFVNSALLEGSEYSFRVRAWGEFAYSAYSNESSAVTNFRPFGTGFQIETLEDNSIHINGFAENFSDPDAGDYLSEIQITSVPFHETIGSLHLDGVEVLQGQILPLSILDKFAFSPAENFTGEISFTFKYSDGKDYALIANTVTVAIIPVNDPPSGEGFEVVTNEDEPLQIEGFETHFHDVDLNDALSGILVATLPDPAFGILEILGNNVNAGDMIGSSDLHHFTFIPAANKFGATSFDFKYSDGESYSPDAVAVHITISPVNDPPVLSEIEDIEIEGIEINIDPIEFTVTDIDDPLSSLVFSPKSSNQLLIKTLTIEPDGDSGQHTLDITVNDRRSGDALISIIVSDGESSDTVTFALTVILITDVEENISDDLYFYPSPFEAIGTVVLPKSIPIPANLTIKDQVGRSIVSFYIRNNVRDLDLSFLPSGIFFLEINTLRSRSYIKIIKK